MDIASLHGFLADSRHYLLAHSLPRHAQRSSRKGRQIRQLTAIGIAAFMASTALAGNGLVPNTRVISIVPAASQNIDAQAPENAAVPATPAPSAKPAAKHTKKKKRHVRKKREAPARAGK